MANDLGSVRRIAQLARSVSSTLDLETVLKRVTAAVAALRPDIACSVRLIDERAGGYRLAGVGGVPLTERTPVIPRGRGLTHTVVDTGSPVARTLPGRSPIASTSQSRSPSAHGVLRHSDWH